MHNRRWFLFALGAGALSGCATPGSNIADDTIADAVAVAYRDSGPKSLTLYTMLNNNSGAGAHTSLMINASQRVIFDPAGSVRLSAMPEIGDVLYGINPTVKDFYERAHARKTFHVRIQTINVSPEVAEIALRLAQANGRVPAAACTTATSTLIGRLPGFESIGTVLFPKKLAEDFARLPGVTERRLYEQDDDDKAVAIANFEARQAVGQ